MLIEFDGTDSSEVKILEKETNNEIFFPNEDGAVPFEK